MTILSASAAIGSLASSIPVIAQPQTGKLSDAGKCSLPPGWDEVAARDPRFVVFGEMHGTQEAPQFVGNIACALALKGKRVLLAVEHSSTENPAFQKAWELPSAKVSRALKRAGWAGRKDGVASQAMLALLVRLHNLSQQGLLIDVVAFNGAKDAAQANRFSHLSGQGPHEAAQAENIRVAAAAHPYDNVLVLVGNLHARKRPVERSGVFFDPMVMQLGPPSQVVTLNMEVEGGTAWNCQLKPGIKPDPAKPITAGAISCGSYPLRGRVSMAREPFIALTAVPSIDVDPDYDGVFWLGRVSASPPAVP